MAFSDPQRIIDDCSIQEGSTVADLGTGTGFYALAAAKAVGEHGKVIAVDIQQDLLARLKTSAQAEHLKNIEVVHGDIEHPGGSRIGDGTVDFAIAANVLFQMESRPLFAKEVARIVRPHGKLLVVDWTEGRPGLNQGSPLMFTREEARALFESSGFSFETGVVAGDHHYGLIFRKK